MSISSAPSAFVLPDARSISYQWTASPSKPNAPVVLLSNPLCAPFRSWDHVVPRLTSIGFSVLRYDQPGHGSSTVPANLSSTTFDSLARDVLQLLNHLSIRQLHAWVGVSMGAATGIVFAAKHPGIIHKLVVCDTISCSPANDFALDVFAPRVAAARRLGVLDAVVEDTAQRWFGREWLEANPQEAERIQLVMLDTTVDGFETCCAALQSENFELRSLAQVAGRGVDGALFIIGEKDANLHESMMDLRRDVECGLRENIGSSSVAFKVIKNAGHACYIDGFDAFIDLVTQFLGDKTEEPSSGQPSSPGIAINGREHSHYVRIVPAVNQEGGCQCFDEDLWPWTSQATNFSLIEAGFHVQS
ncbi:zearalenone lactonase [Hypoxylon fragiforme]|uniref:zearalenone lactonase n=1 Tax=Hypoxylon fragiforme TaxID=63214 RepID=UPI0020C6A1C6|nr:zearalenone lactonase [Hypoxylon fragiforme]KAI2608054.1 zearalenone lactonase [Hypoxylon fragiforme]